MYRYYIGSVKDIKKILNYLENNPLYSTKKLSLERFTVLFKKKIEKNLPTTPEGWIQLKNLCQEINYFETKAYDLSKMEIVSAPLETLELTLKEDNQVSKDNFIQDLEPSLSLPLLKASIFSANQESKLSVPALVGRVEKRGEDLELKGQKTPKALRADTIPDMDWAIGYMEGGSTFYSLLPSDGMQENKNKSYIIRFLIRKQDPLPMYKLQEILGFGTIKQKGENFTFFVSRFDETYKLINLLNGNFRLENTEKSFNKYLEAFNFYVKTKNTGNLFSTVPFIKSEKTISERDSWLGGFFEGRGNFSIHKRKTSTENINQDYSKDVNVSDDHFSLSAISLKFAFFAKDEKNFMNQMIQLFGGGTTASRGYTQYQLSSFEGLQRLLDYLNKYPLQGKNGFAKNDFEKVFEKKIQRPLVQGFATSGIPEDLQSLYDTPTNPKS